MIGINNSLKNNNFNFETKTEKALSEAIEVAKEEELNNTIASISYLTTPHGLANLDNKEWSFHTRQSFSPSGSNNARIYLTAASADLTTDPDGFYLLTGQSF